METNGKGNRAGPSPASQVLAAVVRGKVRGPVLSGRSWCRWRFLLDRWDGQSGWLGRPNGRKNIVRITELPEETQWIGKQKEDNGKQNDSPDIRQRGEATGYTGRDAANHCGRNGKH